MAQANGKQPTFVLPPIHDNPDGSWGPSPNIVPAQFKDIPYSPFSKSEKLGRFADWTELDGSRGAPAGSSSAQAGTRASGRQGGAGRAARNAPDSYNTGGSNAFAYFHVEDESSFSLVDNKGAQPARRPPTMGFSRGRGTPRTGGSAAGGGRGGTGGAGRGGAANARTSRGGPVRRGGWRDWDKSNRTRESSVPISPDWKMLEEIDFPRLLRLRLDVNVEDSEELGTYGQLFAYDKTFDRITPKQEKPLQILNRMRVNATTSDDPIIQELAAKNTAKVYATDAILSWLMCSPRSVYPWDVIVTREGDKLYFDKRDGGPFDFITVNENAVDPPLDNDKEKDSINSPGSLSLEATFVDQLFSFQAVKENTVLRLQNSNPFASPDDTEPLASCGYRYRLFDLGVEEDETFPLVVRTQLEAYIPAASIKSPPQYVTLRTLNEFDSKAQGAGGAPDWRSKLDSQRGAVVATEMKNNSFKLSKWAIQSILAGADVMKIGYVSRMNPRDSSRHTTLTTATLRPTDFATQLNVSLSNGWGIIRMISDMCLKQPEGKYLLIKDPNKSVIRLYAIPSASFTAAEEEPEVIEEEEAAE